MSFAEPYPAPPPDLQHEVASYLGSLIPPGVIGSGVAVVLTGLTVILAVVGHRHARRGVWCSGWLSGPLGIAAALWAASYANAGLPALAGVSPGDVDPRTILSRSLWPSQWPPWSSVRSGRSRCMWPRTADARSACSGCGTVRRLPGCTPLAAPERVRCWPGSSTPCSLWRARPSGSGVAPLISRN